MSLCSALLFLCTLAVASARGPTTVYMIRHGEKPADKNDQGLTPDGWRRAECLRDVFGADSEYNIQHIIAPPVMQNGEHRRPYMTVLPLAHDLGLQIDDHCTRKDPECVADAIRSYDGTGNILISWRHSNMDEIQELLGSENPVDYPINRFDLIWTMPYPYNEITDIYSEECPGLDVRPGLMAQY
ncbi:uncharacterized protein N7498_001062 [Penicillium cinerascens]|uniref:Phosphoglycerate mutase family protein n=1 Tax=Penicillium cinerascens TaxID=70096 RepID=A0A9W9NHY7_9EURO|nr:uncharacterized protein N7498_001062 [Penicillium cinerascens]KAJ5218963.1 hypothetical protein N7498_001062 [Penicillium cinerascens]